MRPLVSAPDKREAENAGESKNGHFSDSVMKARMAGVIGSRVSDRQDLTFGLEPYGDD